MSYVNQFTNANNDPQALQPSRPQTPMPDFSALMYTGQPVEFSYSTNATMRTGMSYGPQLPTAYPQQQPTMQPQYALADQTFEPLAQTSPFQAQFDMSRTGSTMQRGDALSAAIDNLIAMLMNSTSMPGNAGATTGEQALNNSIAGLQQALQPGGAQPVATPVVNGAPAPGAAPAAPGTAPAAQGEPAPAEQERTMRKVEGNELVGMLDASGKGVSNNPNGIGVAGGIHDSELGRDEMLTFKAPGGLAHGATIEVGMLFGDEKITGQERGTIEVVRPDGSVEEVQFNGTSNGNQTVEIEGPFTELRMKSVQPEHLKEEKKGWAGVLTRAEDSDYSVKSIEFGEATPADKKAADDSVKAANTTESGNVIEEKTYSGDELTGMLDAGGRGIKLKDGKIGVDGGVNDKQIGAGEAVTFKPEGGLADGATIDVANLSADNKSGQERGVIEVVRPDGKVEEVTFNGTESGDQQVKIEGEFTELRIKPTQFDGGDEKTKISNGFLGIGKKYEDSDFSIRSISAGTIKEAKPEETAPPANEAAPANGATTVADNTAPAAAPAANFDMMSMMQTVQSFQQTRDLIDSAPLDPGQKQAAQQALAGPIDTLAAAIDPNGEGGAQITVAEAVQILQDVQAVIPIAQVLGGELGNAILASLATGLEGVTKAVLAGQPAAPATDGSLPTAAPAQPPVQEPVNQTTPQTAIA